MKNYTNDEIKYIKSYCEKNRDNARIIFCEGTSKKDYKHFKSIGDFKWGDDYYYEVIDFNGNDIIDYILLCKKQEDRDKKLEQILKL